MDLFVFFPPRWLLPDTTRGLLPTGQQLPMEPQPHPHPLSRLNSSLWAVAAMHCVKQERNRPEAILHVVQQRHNLSVQVHMSLQPARPPNLSTAQPSTHGCLHGWPCSPCPPLHSSSATAPEALSSTSTRPPSARRTRSCGTHTTSAPCCYGCEGRARRPTPTTRRNTSTRWARSCIANDGGSQESRARVRGRVRRDCEAGRIP